MKIIPTWPRANLPRFPQTALQDCTGEVDYDKIHYIGLKDTSPTQKLVC